MTFNSDVTKPAQKVIFSYKSINTNLPPVLFNDIPVARAYCQKLLGMHLDNKLNFNQHIKEKIFKANKVIGIIRKLHETLQITSFVTIYKSFVRVHLDLCDIIYDQSNSKSFVTKSKEYSIMQHLQLLDQ